MKPWHFDSQTFEKFKSDLALQHPTLHVYLEDGRVLIKGTLFLRDKNVEIDHYQIEIDIPNSFPIDLPAVREVGGRIPKSADRHINTENNEACVILPEERSKYFPTNNSITDFIKGPVENFFLSQTYYEKTKKWLSGQWSHGADGIKEYYGEILESTDDNVIEICIEYLTRKELKGHWSCYCGSGKPIRSCHIETLKTLRSQISPRIAIVSLQKFRDQKKFRIKRK
jgi:hypothetical protein